MEWLYHKGGAGALQEPWLIGCARHVENKSHFLGTRAIHYHVNYRRFPLCRRSVVDPQLGAEIGKNT